MRNEERAVFQDFKQFANVVEAWALYDSIVICSNFYGSEANVGGWFNTFNQFGAQETHSLFKTRTEGTAGLAYTNQQSADSMDFAFIAHSIGLSIQVPAPNIEGALDTQGEGVIGDIFNPDALIGHFIGADLPRHMAIQLKIQQDIRAEIQALMAPPGYGATGSGVAFQKTDDATPAYGDIPYMQYSICQGVPTLSNRYPLPAPIGIPRTATIEGILHVSEFARNVLSQVLGPRSYNFNSSDGSVPYTFFPRRYVIQFSLIGERLVQQRAEYHR